MSPYMEIRIPRVIPAFLILAACPICRCAESSSFQDRLKGALDLMSEGRFEEAVSSLLRLRADFPDEEICEYNLGCAYSRWGEPEKALEHLGAAVEKGYDDVLWMRSDPDLVFLRGRPTFRDILKAARTKFLDSIDFRVLEPKPRDPGKKLGLLIQMGGSGSDGSDWVPFWEAIRDGGRLTDTVVVTCQYLSDDPDGNHGQDALPDNAFALLGEMALERWPIDPRRIVIAGFSAGASNAVEFVVRHPEEYSRALIIEGASRDLGKSPGKLEPAMRAGIRVAILAGEQPGLFRLAAESQAALLRHYGIQARLRTFPQERQHKIEKAAAPHVLEAISWLIDGVPQGAEPSREIAYEYLEPKQSPTDARHPALIFFAGVDSRAEDWKRRFAAMEDDRRLGGLIVLIIDDPGGSKEAYATPESRYREAVEFLLRQARERWPIDDGRLFLGGFSDGAFHATRIAFTDPRSWRGVLSIEGITYLNNEGPRVFDAAAEKRTKICFLMGEEGQAFTGMVGLSTFRLPERARPLFRFTKFPQEKFRSVDDRLLAPLGASLRWMLAQDEQ